MRYRFQFHLWLPAGGQYRVLNDPHYWFAKYTCHADWHQQALGCFFGVRPKLKAA